ncbi:PEPxxWA-CTERM sorting domain-containing protein [Pseudoduganella sp. FT55W]|uniref:PEPxxWA-CTERM sorting domain-containing protein n=1 Tax=Duganella rivi TaxID=2666083 RepID=A0A7X4KCI9_9BURK|nr:PEPxxWA-CTERM sorting domain-containing protein [Duganella rivi]MYM67388.1 PEPxxWA-CTERM sorting domain-containing protein [Duganella rivi]
MKHTIFAAALALASISAAQAAAINGLYNTGTGAEGSEETHYSLSSTSVAATKPTVTFNNVWPVDGTWIKNSGDSKWITPTATQGESLDPSVDGIYTYTLKFDLTGYNASSAEFLGRVSADNSVVVKLNGSLIGSGDSFKTWGSFGADDGFLAGVNTLQFIVTNDKLGSGNPTGLRVEFTSSNVSAVPEPATYGMMLGGLALVGAVARRRKQK